MAKPTYYPDWATDDVNLPGTGQANKVKTRDIIRTTGWDKGQIPTAEELNWEFNNLGKWIRFLVDESLPTYLPNTGTKVTFSGDLTGTILWNGTKEVTANIQVVDNSHKHLSADISDATYLSTPNTIVKRDGAGTIIAGDIISTGSSTTDTPTFFLRTYGGTNTGSIDSQNGVGGALFINRIRPDNASVISLFVHDDGYVGMPNPRSTTSQEGQASSLVRYDWATGQISNIFNTINQHITNINNSINAQANASASTYVRSFRLTGGGTATNGNNDNTFAYAPNGSVVTAVQQKTNYTAVEYKYLQYNINNNWYTVGVS